MTKKRSTARRLTANGSWRAKYQGYQRIGEYHRALQADAASRLPKAGRGR